LLAIEDVSEKRTKLEEYLDRGIGECRLRDPRIAQLVEDALLHFHEERYELLAWCVLQNHVHVLVHVWQTPLGKLVQSWKRFVATRAEALLTKCHSSTRSNEDADGKVARRRAVFQRQTLQWQREYWDTFMRDREQDRKAIRYIEGNPVKAKLCRMPADWPFGSARFREPRTQTLVLPAHASAARK
jgi:REP element-mobilizing transposase RayT